MGKSKKRILNKNTSTSGTALKRDEAIKSIIKNIKVNRNKKETENLINLFGITTEELLESGAAFEEISSIKYMFI